MTKERRKEEGKNRKNRKERGREGEKERRKEGRKGGKLASFWQVKVSSRSHRLSRNVKRLDVELMTVDDETVV